METYEVVSHLLGKRDSPFMVIRAVEYKMSISKQLYPEAAKSIPFATLVDDLIDSRPCVEEAKNVLLEAKNFYKTQMNMNLRKMLSNSKDVESIIEPEDRAPTITLQDDDSGQAYRQLAAMHSMEIPRFRAVEPTQPASPRHWAAD